MNTPRFIFLDFDGVLVTWTGKGDHKRLDFHPEAVEALNWLVRESQAQIIVSSSWRKSHTLDELQQALDEAGVKAQVTGTTPVLDYKDGLLYLGFTRGQEITAWLQDQPADVRYVVIDDDPNISPHEPHWVRTEFEMGLTLELAHRALEILDGW